MSQLHAGSLFADRFEIDRLAGSGGMGCVYRAIDRHTGRAVALKLNSAPAKDDSERLRFAREVQLVSELNHPGIVQYVAHGLTEQGQSYLAMQWIDGEDLAKRLTRGPLSLHHAVQVLCSACEALAYAHARGVIHRDIKPANLLLPTGASEQVKILDFGIARRQSTPRSVTQTGLVVGTPEYMAPEQARGLRDLTTAVDVFALGCIFYECLTGEAPFAAEHITAALARILFEEPRPLESRLPDLPPALALLCSRMLAKSTAALACA